MAPVRDWPAPARAARSARRSTSREACGLLVCARTGATRRARPRECQSVERARATSGARRGMAVRAPAIVGNLRNLTVRALAALMRNAAADRAHARATDAPLRIPSQC